MQYSHRRHFFFVFIFFGLSWSLTATGGEGNDPVSDAIIVFDAGANAECRPGHLVQFALMGRHTGPPKRPGVAGPAISRCQAHTGLRDTVLLRVEWQGLGFQSSERFRSLRQSG